MSGNSSKKDGRRSRETEKRDTHGPRDARLRRTSHGDLSSAPPSPERSPRPTPLIITPFRLPNRNSTIFPYPKPETCIQCVLFWGEQWGRWPIGWRPHTFFGKALHRSDKTTRRGSPDFIPAMKKLLQLLFRSRRKTNPLLRSYLASYNGSYWQQPGIRHFLTPR
jgi:hypothetical protein